MKCIFDKTHNYLHIIPPIPDDSSDDSGESSSSDDISGLIYKTEFIQIKSGDSITIESRYLGKYLFNTKVVCINNVNLNYYVTKIICNEKYIRFVLNDEVYNNIVYIYYTPVYVNYWANWAKKLTANSRKVFLPGLNLTKCNIIYLDGTEELPEDFTSNGMDSYLLYEDAVELDYLSLWYYDPDLIHGYRTVPIKYGESKKTILIDDVGFIVAGLYKDDILSKDKHILSCYRLANRITFIFNEPIYSYDYQLKYYYTLTEPAREDYYIE